MKSKHDAVKVNQTTQENVEWKDKYLRALADYQNLEKRISETRSHDVKFAARNLIVMLLPAIDDLEKAAILLKNEGLNLAVRKLEEVLKREQVEKIEVLGNKYDPHTMECVEVVEGQEDDKVTEEIRPGYKMFGKVIRATQVKVGRKKLEKVLPR